MNRFASLVFALALFLLLGVPVAVANTPAPHSALAVSVDSEIVWEPCAIPELPTRDCAEFEVPLDYDASDGESISLALAREHATDLANRIGSLFLSPGGPGISGLLMLPQQYAALPEEDEAGQATPVAPPGVTARTTALLVTAIHDPLRVTGSDGMVHLEYDLVLTNVFTSPVTITAIDVLTPDGQSLLRLEGDALEAMTQPMYGRTPMDVVPKSGAVAVLLDVIVPPDQVPARLTHRITYELAPDAPSLAIIGSHEIVGPELAVDPFTPIVIAPPLRGAGWLNLNGCCDASAHRSARLAVDGSHIVTHEMFAIDWTRLEGNRVFTGDGTRNEDYFAFGAEVLAVADGRVAFVRDGLPEEMPNEPVEAVQQPLDFGGNEVVLELAPGVYAFYAHLQPGSIRVHVGDTVTTGQVLGLLGNTGNTTAPHLHFALEDGPDLLTANSLPFVLDTWTLAGTMASESTPTDVRLVGTPVSQEATFPLELTVADFQ
jgi:Peptidase family M23